jgi:GDP/UDP-N,N'-diacetylbacillosamine 2-epimerase (hydrolysing)
MKIAFVITNRASYGRTKSVINEFIKKYEVQITLAGAGLSLKIDFPVKHRVFSLVDSDSLEAMAKTTSLLASDITTIFSNDKPDYVYIHGDRYEMLAVAYAAAYLNIPILHGEGGEDTGTIDQKVRYAISSLADIHFPVTEQSAKRLRDMGCKNVHVVGSTALTNDVELTNTRTEPYIVILHHPNTTDPEDITPLIEALQRINTHKVWVNPNVDAGSKAMLKLIHKQDVEFVKDLSPEEYLRLIYNSKCCVGNSSSFIKEGCFYGIPSVIIGDRQHNREHGRNVWFLDYDRDDIVAIVNKLIKHGRYKPDYRFGDGNASKKIVEVLCTYSP